MMTSTSTTTTRAMSAATTTTTRARGGRATRRARTGRAVAGARGRGRGDVARRAVNDPSSSVDESAETSDGDDAVRVVSRAELVRAAVASGAVVATASRVGGGAPTARNVGALLDRAPAEDSSATYVGKTWDVRHGASALEVREDGTMRLSRTGDGPATRPQTLAVSFGGGATARDTVRVVDARADDAFGSLMVSWSDGTELRVMRTSDATGEEDAWCRDVADGLLVEVTAPPGSTGAAELTVRLCDGGEKVSHWYGGSHLLKQLWPLERAKIEMGPFYPFDHGPNGVGNVLGTHWVSSSGALIFADPNSDLLHVGLNAPTSIPSSQAPRYFGVGIQNASRPSLPLEEALSSERGDGLLRLQSRANYADGNMLHPWQNIETHDTRSRLRLRVAVSAQEDAKSATRVALDQLPKPDVAPNKSLMFSPIWTTWATSHADVTQESTLAVARDILKAKKESGLPNGSIIEIDDRWQARYGELVFDPVKFPDPKAMVKELHDMGFLVTAWVMPFLQESSAACEEAKRLGYLVEGSQPPTEVGEVLTGGFGQILGTTVKVFVDRFDWPPGHWEGGGGGGNLEPGQFRWWGTQPVRGLDFTNEAACEWFVRRLEKLQDEVGLDGFKFDAGEPCFLPYGARTHKPLNHPQEYSQAYVKNVCSKFPLSEVRVGMGTNAYTGLVRMGDKDTVWGVDNGLRSLIPSLLTSAVIGYPFTLPDIIGGNAYWNQTPDTELMIRWAQVSAFMPAVQWSIPPWEVSEEAYAASVEVMRMREELLLPKLEALSDAAKTTLEPICRPMWWLDPKDASTFAIDDQFAVGDDIIIAPVVEKGATSRSVYLPRGAWRRHGDDAVLTGGRRIVVDAPLSQLPVFLRVE